MSEPLRPPRWLLHRPDQVMVAGSVVVAVAAMLVWWGVEGGRNRRVIEIDQTKSVAAQFEVDINTADSTELMQLPGIGPKLAERIVTWRRAVGPFAEPDDLRRVGGIGPKKMEQIRPYVRAIREGAKAGGGSG